MFCQYRQPKLGLQSHKPIPQPQPLAFGLEQNAPNPFNPMTTIRFTLSEPAHARLALYTVTGQLVRVLVDGSKEAGMHEVGWDGRDMLGRSVASGVYVCRLTNGDATIVRRMVLAR